MLTATRLGVLVFVLLALVVTAWWLRGAPADTNASTIARDERRGCLFEQRLQRLDRGPVGDEARDAEHHRVALEDFRERRALV